MDFLNKAKKSMKEAQLRAEGLVSELQKSSISSKESSSEVSTPIATPATTVASTPAPSQSAPSTQANDLSIPRCTDPKAPVKVTLADRKKIRDDFEAKKPELEQAFSETIGGQWTIQVDTAGVHTYMLPNGSGAHTNPGVYIWNYFDGALSRLQEYKKRHGAADVAAIADYAPRRLITLEPTFDDSVTYTDTDFVDGRWRLLFRDINFGINASQMCGNIGDALNKASKTQGSGSQGPGSVQLSMKAKQGIRDTYEKEIEPVLARCQKYLAAPELAFVPNFEANYAALAAFEATLDRTERDDDRKLRRDWEQSLGAATLDYFKGFQSQLEWQKIHKDELVHEGFREAITKMTVSFLVTPDVKGPYNDCVIIDGSLVIRNRPDQYWCNSSQPCEKFMDLL